MFIKGFKQFLTEVSMAWYDVNISRSVNRMI